MNIEENPKENYDKDNIFREEYNNYLSKQNKNQMKHSSCSGKDDTFEDSSIKNKIELNLKNQNKNDNIYEKFNQDYIDLYEEPTASGDLFNLLNNDEIIAEVNQIKSSYSQNDFILPESFKVNFDNINLDSETNK